MQQRTIDTRGVAEAVVDRVGLIVVGLLVAWTAVAAMVAGVAPMPVIGAQVAVVGALVGARLLARWGRWLVPAAAVGVAATIAVMDVNAVFEPAPRSGPFGFSSITGAFFAQAAVAGLMLAVVGAAPLLRLVGALVAGYFALVPLATKTRSATILLIVLSGWALLATTHRRRMVFIRSCRWMIVIAIAGTLLIGAAYTSQADASPLTRLASDVVTARRVALWHDAVVLMVNHPLTGVGPGNFDSFSPVARSDQDEQWAHNEFLQFGAEIGVAGFLLLSAAFVWGISRLLIRHPLDSVAALGAAAVTIVGVHASIEYVLQRPAVPVVAAALLGTAIGPFAGDER
jgi:O-Antigen ligase